MSKSVRMEEACDRAPFFFHVVPDYIFASGVFFTPLASLTSMN
ncbi:hypothetical protein JOE21_002226 [Desmospora profundinema]|uniref:Uncharacterized protein n=1 Tax=Desmospora profundinema TaxID=1571184 RepID=A0ABU1IN57_9BACL|nr:hypothetical protein [Desmospora profundinema]